MKIELNRRTPTRVPSVIYQRFIFPETMKEMKQALLVHAAYWNHFNKMSDIEVLWKKEPDRLIRFYLSCRCKKCDKQTVAILSDNREYFKEYAGGPCEYYERMKAML